MDHRRDPPARGSGSAPLGLLNFRDLGGYRTRDRRHVRRGRVFRSGSLAELTPAGANELQRLGIRVVCDLRSLNERSREPVPAALLDGRDYLVRDHDLTSSDLRVMLRNPATSPDEMRAFMVEAYRALPFEYADSYRSLFGCVSEGRLPMIFHCAAGKDRTGVASALLLSLLGVPWRAILVDYLLTNQLYPPARQGLPPGHRLGRQLAPPESMKPLLRADAAYLGATWQTLREQFGSVDEYLREIGVDEALSDAIRSELLGPLSGLPACPNSAGE
jgi:protein-tyrosine phosphatase